MFIWKYHFRIFCFRLTEKKTMIYSINTSNITNFTNTDHHPLNHVFCKVLASYFIFVAVIGIICNAALIHTIHNNKKLRKTAKYLIINLAVCDLITCFNLAFDSHFLLRHEYFTSGEFLCASTKVTNLTLLPLSVFSLLLLTFEKLLIFLYPFQHANMLTKKKALILLFCTWLYSIGAGCFPIIANRSAVVTNNGACYILLTLPYKLYQLIVNFSLPFVCIITLDIIIFRIAMQSANTRRRLSNSTLKKEVEITNSWRRARTIITVVANESLCWFSYMIAVAASIACGGCLPQEVPWIMNAVNYTSVATNPLIYGLLNRSVRHYVWNICCKSSNTRRERKYGRVPRGSVMTDGMSVSRSSRSSRKSERSSVYRNSVRFLIDRKAINFDTGSNIEMQHRNGVVID